MVNYRSIICLEADVAGGADKEYRKGVHWLETLRLRRVKIIESGFKVRGCPARAIDAVS